MPTAAAKPYTLIGQLVRFNYFGKPMTAVIVTEHYYPWCSGAGSVKAWCMDTKSVHEFSYPQAVGTAPKGAVAEAAEQYRAVMAEYPAWVKQMAAGIDPARDFGISYIGYSCKTVVAIVNPLDAANYRAQVPELDDLFGKLREAVASFKRFGTRTDQDVVEGLEGRIAEVLGVSRWDGRTMTGVID